MTITAISKLADFAELSVASYALFNPAVLNDSVVQSAALRDKASMTATQATDFLNKYEVVTHTPNDSVGFSATVFRSYGVGHDIPTFFKKCIKPLRVGSTHSQRQKWPFETPSIQCLVLDVHRPMSALQASVALGRA